MYGTNPRPASASRLVSDKVDRALNPFHALHHRFLPRPPTFLCRPSGGRFQPVCCTGLGEFDTPIKVPPALEGKLLAWLSPLWPLVARHSGSQGYGGLDTEGAVG